MAAHDSGNQESDLYTFNTFFTLKQVELNKEKNFLRFRGDFYFFNERYLDEIREVALLARRAYDIYDCTSKKYYKSAKEFIKDVDLYNDDIDDNLTENDKVIRKSKGTPVKENTIFQSHPELEHLIVYDYKTYNGDLVKGNALNLLSIEKHNNKNHLWGFHQGKNKYVYFGSRYMSNIFIKDKNIEIKRLKEIPAHFE